MSDGIWGSWEDLKGARCQGQEDIVESGQPDGKNHQGIEEFGDSGAKAIEN